MKEFVLYEEALKLKELGFDELCIGYYDNMRSFAKNYVSSFTHHEGEPFTKKRNSQLKQLRGYVICTAPTYSQAFKFFRKKYNQPQHSITYDESEIDCLRKLIDGVKKG